MLSVAVEDEGPRLAWVPKPIGVRHDAAGPLGLDRPADAGPVTVSGLDVVHVGPAASDPEAAARSGLRPGLLLALDRAPASTARVVARHPADLTVSLLELSFDVDRLGAAALAAAAGLAAASAMRRARLHRGRRRVAPITAALGSPVTPTAVHDIGPAVDDRTPDAPRRSAATASMWSATAPSCCTDRAGRSSPSTR